MEGSYVQWQKEVIEEVHKAVLKRKRVHDDKIVPVPDKIRDRNITPILVQRFQIWHRWMSPKGSPDPHFLECVPFLFVWCSSCMSSIGDLQWESRWFGTSIWVIRTASCDINWLWMMLIVAWLTMVIIKGGNLKCWRQWNREWWKISGVDWFSSNVQWCWIPRAFWSARSSCKHFIRIKHGDWSSRWCQSWLFGVWKFQ